VNRRTARQPADGISIRDDEFELFRRLIRETCGISLSAQKRQLLCSRLGRRLRHHELETFSEYYDYLRSEDPDGEELRQLINCVTTNKTEFFREPHHFDFLRASIVPALLARAARGEPRKIRIWSAGCSSGEEPYSIAMLLADCLPGLADWDIKILASDIDTEVLARAAAAVYSENAIAPVPRQMRRAWLESYGSDGEYRVSRTLRDLVKFRHINLIRETWPIRSRFDVIFCRNVTIYFNRPTQQRLYEHFTRYLQPEGYFVAGHSENLSWLSHLFSSAGNTIYRLEPEPAAQKSLRSTRRSLPPGPSSGRQSRRPAHSKSGRQSLRPAHTKTSGAAERAAALERELVVEGGVARARIQSGEVYASRAPSLVSTVLGSCVASCLFDPIAGIGGMNHFMLPDSTDSSGLPSRYGVHSMELLINQLLGLGAQRHRLKAKVFGGAHVLRHSQQGRKIAEANALFAKEFLAREGIEVLGERLGGERPLQVNFFTHTGRVLLRTIRGQERAVAERELSYRRELNESVNFPVTGGVTLF